MQQILHKPDGAAELTCFPAETGGALPAVVICPGGGYSWLSPRESGPVARMFSANGFHAFVLRYTVENPPLRTHPLMDLSWAVSELRGHAAELCIRPDRIAVCGFSAGGHLAASLGAFWNDRTVFPSENVRLSHRPNAVVLGYPVITSGRFSHRESFDRLFPDRRDQDRFSLERRVGPDMPPVFLWHTVSDRDVPAENSVLFAQALLEQGIPCELHLYDRGVHGLSLATPEVEETAKSRFADPHIASWAPLCVEWLKGILAAGPSGEN
ncbi:alpha/beta hydrolase [Caproiciproducens sp. NJN-50]|uniref:alpha/beta hydrolase n=1 Tax=Caproiciproducens sp. NJN-50 TaxID=2507162 RepID=UPI000FFE2625|nr:alpha/beta hydrolase [Caproiciproducens sp. NJN-50]QAT48764.1 alpha/beta hydrolase [Caproiciproducens sp. NJN-50]